MLTFARALTITRETSADGRRLGASSGRKRMAILQDKHDLAAILKGGQFTKSLTCQEKG